MSTLNDIAAFTGERVYKVRAGYLVILSDAVNRGSNPAIARTKQAYRLRDKSMDDLPIGFQIVDHNNWVKQYWTVNGQLHSDVGPSIVGMHTQYDSRHQLRLEYYRNGVIHRKKGPARESYSNIRFENDDNGDVHVIADDVTWSWFNNGLRGNPKQAVFPAGFRKIMREDKMICLEAPRAEFKWEHDNATIDKDSSNLLPSFMRIEDLREEFESPSRTGRITMSRWWYHKSEYTVIAEDVGYPQDYHLNGINLWEWPFYRGSDTQYLMFEEWQKLNLT